jgi:uncharacterized BrkB/YihY/UPF0761 family membrane protein
MDFALFPAITAVVSLYGLFTYVLNHQRAPLLAGFLPSGAMDIVQEQVSRLAFKGMRSLASVSFLIRMALWSANVGVKAIIDASM